jgi:hypothetical protein
MSANPYLLASPLAAAEVNGQPAGTGAYLPVLSVSAVDPALRAGGMFDKSGDAPATAQANQL